LNNIIPDDDDDMLPVGLNNNSNINNSGTLGKSKNNALKPNSNKMSFELPNKSFNTYTNQRDASKINSKISSNNLSNSIKGLNMQCNSNSNNNNTLRYSNYINNYQSGSIRSNAKQQRAPANSVMRTNLDQEP
jgi:hypothetical protein